MHDAQCTILCTVIIMFGHCHFIVHVTPVYSSQLYLYTGSCVEIITITKKHHVILYHTIIQYYKNMYKNRD